MDTACPPACLTLSLTLPLPSSPLQGTHMPVLQKKQVTLPEACEGFINVITVLTVSTSIHQFLFISMCLLIHSSRHVPSSQPEPTCWFLPGFVFSPREGLLRVHVHSHHNHVACQWYSCTCLNWRAAYCTAPLEQFGAHLSCLKASFDSCCGGSCFPSLYRNPQLLYNCKTASFWSQFGFSNKVLHHKSTLLLFFWSLDALCQANTVWIAHSHGYLECST